MRSFPVSFEEVDWDEGFKRLNECDYLFVREIRQIEELTLGLLLTEAKPQAAILKPKDSSEWEKLWAGARPIEEDTTCRVFQLIFEQNHMVSYSVLNESYGKYPEPFEEFTGRLFRVFSRSHLLDFTKKNTIACDEYPGILQHYEIAAQNHVIDVIATMPPRIAVSMWRDHIR